MKKLIQSAVRERSVTIFLAFIILVSGFYSYYVIPKQENPDVTPPFAIITTIYPGATSEDVEKLVTIKVEDAVASVEGVNYIRSFSRNSVSTVVIELKNSVDPDKTWDKMRIKLNDLNNELPDSCQDSVLNTNLVETAGIIISLSGENYTYEQLASYAEVFKKELSRIDGVTRFDVDGKVEKQVKIEVQIEQLNQTSLSLEDVHNMLQAQNIEIPSGNIKTKDTKISVKTQGLYTSLQEIENTIVGASQETGAVIRLGDIAKVYMELEEDVEQFRQNGENAILLTGYFEKGKNIVLIGKDVRKSLDDIKGRFPPDVKIDEVSFQPEDVNRSVTSFTNNLLQGVVFVVIVVLVGMGLRNALIVSTAIPLSIMATISIMNLIGIEIHQISTAALIIALGMLVDNAIVISDAIQVKLDEGMGKHEACIQGTVQSAIPVFTSTLTTLAAFSPLLMIPGVAGEFARSIPQVVMIALTASFLVAMIVVPALASIFFRPTKSSNKKESPIRQIFDRLLEFGLRKKGLTVMIAFAVLFASALLMSQVGLQFFPYTDKAMMYLDIEAETVGNLDKTKELVMQVEKMLGEEPENTMITSAVGGGLPKFYMTIPITVPAQNAAQILIQPDLKKGGSRFKTYEEFAAHLQERLDQEVSGGAVKVNMLAYAEPGSPIEIRVVGEDMQVLKDISLQLQEELRKLPGTMNIKDDAGDSSYEYEVVIDSDTATHMGLTRYDVQREINIALYGSNASVYRKAGNEYSIVVKSNIEAKSELENLAIKSRVTGSKILLKQVSDIRIIPQMGTITRYDREVSITITSDVKPGYSPITLENYFQKNVMPQIDQDGFTIVFDGEKNKIMKNFGNIGLMAVFAVCAIYIILLIQFNSFVQPLVIMITIPLSLIGVILGLFVFRLPLSFTSLLGVVSLIGIVVNNAILLIEYMNEARKAGHSLDEACITAVDQRFRPIILSTTTTVIGLIPLAMSRSPIFTPMAICLMGGLLVSTLLTMVIIPVVYSMIEGTIHRVMNGPTAVDE